MADREPWSEGASETGEPISGGVASADATSPEPFELAMLVMLLCGLAPLRNMGLGGGRDMSFVERGEGKVVELSTVVPSSV